MNCQVPHRKAKRTRKQDKPEYQELGKGKTVLGVKTVSLESVNLIQSSLSLWGSANTVSGRGTAAVVELKEECGFCDGDVCLAGTATQLILVVHIVLVGDTLT